MEAIPLTKLSKETEISESTLKAWRQQGRPPVSFKVGKKIFYRREDINAWLEEQYEQTRAGVNND